MAGVLVPVCERYHVRFTDNRGYSSASARWEAAQRVQAADQRGQHAVLIYLGDHDPSGLDMSRDVRDRLDMLSYGTPLETIRLALNYDQVEEYQPPANPAKLTDSRAHGYVTICGHESWELDALDPQTLDALLSEPIEELMDQDLYDEAIAEEEAAKERLARIARELRDEAKGHE